MHRDRSRSRVRRQRFIAYLTALFVCAGLFATIGRAQHSNASVPQVLKPAGIGDPADPTSGIVTNASDNGRTGWYPDQPGLTPSEINGNNFGQLFSATLNGGIGSQPLLADGTLLVTTQANWAYGLDPQSGVIKWSRQVGVPWQPADIGCTDVTSGVRSTPVIDASAGIAYFTSKTYVSGTTGPATWRLFAISLATGADQPGFPVTLQGTAQNNSAMTFNATDQLQRPGLLLLNGVVYMGFGSNCDRGTYQGWIFGVSTSGATKARWVDCGLGAGGLCAGIWQSGGGLASDKDGNIVIVTGNNASPTPPIVRIHATSQPRRERGTPCRTTRRHAQSDRLLRSLRRRQARHLRRRLRIRRSDVAAKSVLRNTGRAQSDGRGRQAGLYIPAQPRQPRRQWRRPGWV